MCQVWDIVSSMSRKLDWGVRETSVAVTRNIRSPWNWRDSHSETFAIRAQWLAHFQSLVSQSSKVYMLCLMFSKLSAAKLVALLMNKLAGLNQMSSWHLQMLVMLWKVLESINGISRWPFQSDSAMWLLFEIFCHLGESYWRSSPGIRPTLSSNLWGKEC